MTMKTVSTLLLLVAAPTLPAAPPLGLGTATIPAAGPAVDNPWPSSVPPASADADASGRAGSRGKAVILSDPAPPSDPNSSGPPNPAPVSECPANTPIRIDDSLCIGEDIRNQIEAGGQLAVNPDGSWQLTPQAPYDPIAGNWTYYPAQQACNPNIGVKLKEAALAGSQLVRAISDQQMDYPEVDPLLAVKNSKPDGYGGSCTIPLFDLDPRAWLGNTYDQIKHLIDTLAHLNPASLFGAACQVINTIFGDLQRQLRQDLQGTPAMTAFQQFTRNIRVGFIAPLASFGAIGTVQATHATITGVTTSGPLLVVYVPELGYAYLAPLDVSTALVLEVSKTPLSPGDAP